MSYPGMTQAEGDRIAQMVLQVVQHLVDRKPDSGLEHNVRPEPPEATLGYLPRRVA